MLICPQCQFENSNINKFCQRCGTSLLHLVCPKCGVNVAFSEKECHNCGTVTGTVWWAIISRDLGNEPPSVTEPKEDGAMGRVGEDDANLPTTPPHPLIPSSPTPSTIFTISNSAEIPAAELPHIFEKFYRVPNANPWQQSGTGLGLALVQKLLEQMQGTIKVESSRGWTTFTVELPNQPRD